MGSRLSVFQLVASHLGQDEQILDPGDDTRLVVAIKAVWDTARRAALRANNWNFATARAQLAADTIQPEFGFSYSFTMPADFVRLIEIVGPLSDSRDWTLEGGKLLANSTPLQVLYVADCVNVAQWDDMFEMAVSLKIAALIALNITGDVTVRQDCDRAFKELFADAQAVDGTENPPVQFVTDSWIDARVGYGAMGWTR